MALLGLLIFIPVAIGVLMGIGALLRLLFSLFKSRERLASRILFWASVGLALLSTLGSVFYLSARGGLDMDNIATLGLLLALNIVQSAALIGFIVLGYKLTGRFFRKADVAPSDFD